MAIQNPYFVFAADPPEVSRNVQKVFRGVMKKATYCVKEAKQATYCYYWMLHYYYRLLRTCWANPSSYRAQRISSYYAVVEPLR